MRNSFAFLTSFLFFASLCTSCFSTGTEFRFDDEALNRQKSSLSGTAQLAAGVKRMIFFGDSFTDSTGNLSRLTHGEIPTPVYHWQGRFSNGPLWNEYLIGALNVPSINYAVAGTRIKQTNTFGAQHGLVPISVKGGDAQIDAFVKQEKRFLPTDLVFMWFGSNDYLFDADSKKVDTFVSQTIEYAQKLIDLGARNLVVLELIPFEDVPLPPRTADGKEVNRDDLGQMINSHNAKLKARLVVLTSRNPEVKVHDVNIDNAIRNVRAHAAQYGLKNTKEPCFTGQTIRGGNSPVVLALTGKDRKGLVCPSPRDHMFWDKAHPTTTVHCLSAEFILSGLLNEKVLSNFDAAAAESRCLAIGNRGEFLPR